MDFTYYPPPKLPKPKLPKEIFVHPRYFEPQLSDFPVLEIPRLYYTVFSSKGKFYHRFHHRPLFLGQKKIKRSYYSKQFFFTHLRLYKIRKHLAKQSILKQKIGILFIKIRRHNTFLSLHSESTKYLKTKLSAGILGFKGRKKGAPLVREELGKQIAHYIRKTRYKIIDIIFKSKTGSMYRHVIRGLIKKKIGIRKITIKHTHPHGYIRQRKRRRT